MAQGYYVWGAVQPIVAQFTRVCSYDRAGFGFSSDSKASTSTEQMVLNLHALLEKGIYLREYLEPDNHRW